MEFTLVFLASVKLKAGVSRTCVMVAGGLPEEERGVEALLIPALATHKVMLAAIKTRITIPRRVRRRRATSRASRMSRSIRRGNAAPVDRGIDVVVNSPPRRRH